MANNRMWLVYRPLKVGMLVGKTMNAGWYSATSSNHLRAFYDYCFHENRGQDPDDFELLREDQPGWNYDHSERPGNFQKFKLGEE